MMSDRVEVTQKSALGSDTTQIAVQENYYGMTAEEASALAIKLFMDNFPKLQEEAGMIAKERAEELCKEVLAELTSQGKKDFREFSDPDMQFIMNKSQQEYARFGSNELRELLKEIIVNRVNYNENDYLKLIFDEAIDIAKSLTVSHVNYLSLVFLSKQVKFNTIRNIGELKAHCEYICAQMPVPPNIMKSVPFLNMQKLFTLSLGSVSEIYARNYRLPKEEVDKVLPSMLKWIHPDYELSPLGIAIAIINIQNKTNIKLKFETWLKAV